jgi:hypothetical protein
MSYSLEYPVLVDVDDDGSATAYLGDRESPMRGHGESALQAVRALCESIREWPIGGADRWLNTPAGVTLARRFCPTFEPGKPGASS